ncbi:DUF305 domain-containing protein [Egicoccus sp. AB-alg2]|uniref:DUF305 domain-containing protein n=1 Tax=Egicoccus sp. AB-alg2 TaxID=3242693 RepID=UPI00359D71A2
MRPACLGWQRRPPGRPVRVAGPARSALPKLPVSPPPPARPQPAPQRRHACPDSPPGPLPGNWNARRTNVPRSTTVGQTTTTRTHLRVSRPISGSVWFPTRPSARGGTVVRRHLPAVAAGLALLASCTTSSDSAPDEAIPTAESTPDAAASVDREFLEMMIPHHEQAVLMIGWVEERTASDEVRWLTRQMGRVQANEIDLMRGWLDGLPDGVATSHGHHHHDMPGMLDDATLEAMASAAGREFDRRFLAGMIEHHEGALDMVERYFTEAAPDSDLIRFAKKLFDDQQVEIGRMRALLRDLDA